MLVGYSVPAGAAESVSIVYQNDLHGWVFPSSTRVGLGRMAEIIGPLFQKEPSSFYAVSGDLFTGPNLPADTSAASILNIWKHFWKQLDGQGFGKRVLISAGNHEFDYGIPGPGDFSSGLLCANLLTLEGQAYYVPYRIIDTEEGLRIGFLGLVTEKIRHRIRGKAGANLRTIPIEKAVRRFLPEMGKLDLTILMVHDDISNILALIRTLPPELGVDMVLSGHDHAVFEEPNYVNGIPVFQAGAMNGCYGKVDLLLERGRIVSLKNRITFQSPTPLEHAMMRVKEKVDELNGKKIALLKRSLLGACLRNMESSLGDFVTDAFRWATGTDVAMTNSGSLRIDFPVIPGESFELREGNLRDIIPWKDHLVVGQVTGAQIMQILEGEAVHFRNQVSGLTYKIDRRLPAGTKVLEARIGGKPLSLSLVYTLTHNSYCTRPDNMQRYLHLKPGSVTWRDTHFVDNEVLEGYARYLGVVDYPSQGGGRVVILP